MSAIGGATGGIPAPATSRRGIWGALTRTFESGLAKTVRRFGNKRISWQNVLDSGPSGRAHQPRVTETPLLYGAREADFVSVRLSS
jgi:hypothetical protein